MTRERLENILKIGETVAVEFKRCGGNIESDVYETVCSFSNRFGGDIFLGVLDDGTVSGVPEKAAPSLVKNFISVLANPDLFTPTLCLDPQIMQYKDKTLIHIHVPVGGDVVSYKKNIYNRINDSDVKVTSSSDIAQMYIRKQEIFTERRVYPYIKMEDLRLDLLPMVRTLAKNNASGNHPWEKLTDEELLKSAGLYAKDRNTDEYGINLAGIMLLGRDEIIKEISPLYQTDALLRKVNLDRYDDRLTVETNLLESFDLLFGFAQKHLLDKFYLEDGKIRLSLRNVIIREMIVNTLMHREFTSGYQAKFIIEKDKMFVENANRAKNDDVITPENLEPYPKNPLIANFFRNIGYSDKLGSGVRKLFKYSKFYSGKNPEFIEGDVFRIIVPINDEFVAPEGGDFEVENVMVNESASDMVKDAVESSDMVNDRVNVMVLDLISQNPAITALQIAEKLKKSERQIRRLLANLKQENLIRHIGSDKTGHWEIIKK